MYSTRSSLTMAKALILTLALHTLTTSATPMSTPHGGLSRRDTGIEDCVDTVVDNVTIGK